MKRLFPCMAFFCTVLSKSAFSAPDILLVHRLETLTAADGSGVLCFTSVPPPGIECHYETSNDLVHWQTVTSVYGLG